MAWPSALTDNTDILKNVWEQGITRMLESGNAYTDVHTAVSTELRIWLENDGGVPDADLVTNTADFVPAAAHYFCSKILANRDKELSDRYFSSYTRLRKEVNPKLSEQMARGGSVAKVVLLKQGSSHYTSRRNGAVFKDYRI